MSAVVVGVAERDGGRGDAERGERRERRDRQPVCVDDDERLDDGGAERDGGQGVCVDDGERARERKR